MARSNFDPDKAAPVPDGMVEYAMHNGLQVIHFVHLGDTDGTGAADFFTLAPSIPQRGDRVSLPNGPSAVVVRTSWKIVQGPPYPAAVPNVVLAPASDDD
ncbi:MAG: hypothetical protein AAF916_09825 [Planctomycetota bacterium]